jgi:adenine phosphoribosyltransferase
MNLKSFIRDIPDFPKQGIIFRDITPLMANAEAFKFSVQEMAEPFRNSRFQKVAAIESRGFFFGPSVAIELGCGFVPVRKKGKLPWQTDSETYSLEYGEASIEIHKDAFTKGERVLLLDDVLATGGTISAAIRLIEKQGALIEGITFLAELDFLHGRKAISKSCLVHSLVHFT